MTGPYSLSMTYATIFVALVLAACIVRIVYLNSEIKALDIGAKKFLNQVEIWRTTSVKGRVALTHEAPKEIQEAQTEYEWAINAQDSKKESRAIWLGAAAMSFIALVTAIVEVSRNSY